MIRCDLKVPKMRHKSDQNALVTAAGMGAVMYMLDKIKNIQKMQQNEKYRFLHKGAKKALLKHLLVTAARMRTVMYLLVFKRSQSKVLFCNKMLKPYSTV